MSFSTALPFTGGLTRSGTRLGRLILLSVAVGLVSGLVARALETALLFGTQHLIGKVIPPGGHEVLTFRWGVLLLPALGGLISGLIVGLFCKPTRAHGTAVLIDAFHHFGAELSLRSSLLKSLAAVAVISLGGSVGKEAVIAVLAAAIGSAMAGRLGLTPRERRMFLIAGCAAGVGAIFQCPLGGAIFATTVLYREPEIEADALLPSIIASVTSYSTFMAFGGYGLHLLNGTGNLVFTHPIELAAYTGLAFGCALASIIFYYCLEATLRFMHQHKLPRWLAPAGAGLLMGLVACGVPQVMDSRYQFVQNMLNGDFLRVHSWTLWVLLCGLVVVGKCLATGLMIGSECAGGLFGPVLFIGGTVGATAGAFIEAFLPGTFPESLRQALIPVGMAGVLAASLRTPLAAIVMVTEMTGSYGLIVPLMLVSVLAYMLGKRWGVYPEQEASPSESPAHAGESLVTMLENWTVKDLLLGAWPYLATPATPLPQLLALVKGGTRPVFAVVDKRLLAGTISTADISRVVNLGISSQVIIAADIMSPAPAVIYPEDDLYGTLEIFRRYNVDALPAVDRGNGEFVGMLTRAEIIKALRSRLREQRAQMLREHAGFAALDNEVQLADLFSEFTAAAAEDNVQRMKVPKEITGQSLSQCDFRRRYACQVIAIETAAGELLAPPDPHRPLLHDEVLIVLPQR